MNAVEVATWIVTIARAYLLLGAGVAVATALFGLPRIDPAARGGTLGFRLVVLPGLALLWPWTLWRVVRATGPPAERNAHRLRATEAGRTEPAA